MRSAAGDNASFQRLLLVGVLLGLCLVLLGWALVPTASLLSVAGACLILIIYGLVYYFALPRVSPQVIRWALLFGLLAGVVFVAEILMEYALLPKDNTSWGIAEFALIFFIYLVSAFWTAYRSRNLRAGLLTAVLTAMVSSLIWVIAVLAVFYAFRGSPSQQQVFATEGNYADFARSGMADFNTFIMEDFFGAVFFHSLLMPLVAAILGVIGAALGSIRFKPAVKSKTGI
jgi:hypothetical protein